MTAWRAASDDSASALIGRLTRDIEELSGSKAGLSHYDDIRLRRALVAGYSLHRAVARHREAERNLREAERRVRRLLND